MAVVLAWFLGAVVAAAEPVRGVKITTQEGPPGGVTHQTVRYVAEDRSRIEVRTEQGLQGASITRCDQQTSILLNYPDRTFSRTALASDAALARRGQGTSMNAVERVDGPAEVIETKTVQTGERKEAFGFTARRVTTTERLLLDEVASQGLTETDGWYIDLITQPACERATHARAFLMGVVSNGGRVRVPNISFRDIGAREYGFPIDVTTTYRRNGQSFVYRTVVRELTQGPLDGALFEIPAGFHNAIGLRAWLDAQATQMWHSLRLYITSFWR